MTDLSDKDLADIREMQRVRGPSVRSLVVSLAVYGPTVVMALLGIGLGLYLGRLRIILGALVLALAWGVGASRSWDEARHRRKEQLWLRVAGTAIALVVALGVGLFIGLDVQHRLFGYPVSEPTVTALRATLQEHTQVLERRAARFAAVGRWRAGQGPRPDLGACADASGQADEVPRDGYVLATAATEGLPDGPLNASVIFPSGVPVFREVDTSPAVTWFEAQLTQAPAEPVDEALLLARAAQLNVQAERLVFLVVDEYTPATRLDNGRAVPASLHGTAFTLTADADDPTCAAYVDVTAPPGDSQHDFAAAVARAVETAPFFAAGEVSRDPSTLDPPRMLVVNDEPRPVTSASIALPGTSARVEVAPLLTYVGQGFTLQYPAHLTVGDPTPQPTVELMDPDGSVLRVARGDCATLGDSHGMILAALHDSGTSRQATRMIGNARVRGAAASATPGTMEVYLHELQPPTENPLPEEDQPGLCALAFVETLRAMPPAWVGVTLSSVRDDTLDDPHPVVPPAELVVGEQRIPMALGVSVPVPAGDGGDGAVAGAAQRVELRFNAWRLAFLNGLQVHVPAGAYARVSGGTSNEAELHIVQGALELHLRVARAPSTQWASSAERLSHAQQHGPPTAPISLLGQPRVGVLLSSDHGNERLYAFDHAGYMLEVSVSYAADTDETAVDAMLSAVVGSVTLSPQ